MNVNPSHPFSRAVASDYSTIGYDLSHITPEQIRKEITGEIYGGRGYIACRLSNGIKLEAGPQHDHGRMVAAWHKRYTIVADYR